MVEAAVVEMRSVQRCTGNWKLETKLKAELGRGEAELSTRNTMVSRCSQPHELINLEIKDFK